MMKRVLSVLVLLSILSLDACGSLMVQGDVIPAAEATGQQSDSQTRRESRVIDQTPIGSTVPVVGVTDTPTVALTQPESTPSAAAFTSSPLEATILASSDNWKRIGLEGVAVNDLEIDPWTLTTLYAGTEKGVFKSTDDGGTWREANIGLTDSHVLTLVIDPQIEPEAPNTLYAGTHDSGVFKSTDGGESWVMANDGMGVIGINDLAIAPTSPPTLYAATQGGMFESIDSGASWVGVGSVGGELYTVTIDPVTPTTVYATDCCGVYRSTDGYESQTYTPLGARIFALAINRFTPSILCLGTEHGVLKSIDSGESWVPTRLAEDSVLALTFDPKTASTFYAGTLITGVFISADDGNSWSAIFGLTIPNVRVLVMDVMSMGSLYAGSYESGIFHLQGQ
jgi:photosystem II stability/assembly factor-like uncharacterized protein